MIIGMLRLDLGRIVYRLGSGASPRLDPMRIGYLPEERGLYLDVPVRRMLLYFAALRGMPAREARRAADRWLDRFELADRAGAEVRDLSKGNQQKVPFISAILHRPAGRTGCTWTCDWASRTGSVCWSSWEPGPTERRSSSQWRTATGNPPRAGPACSGI
jgi:hypothetical protein